MSETETRVAHGARTPQAIGIGVVLALVAAVVVLAFSWPAVTSEPRDLPLGVAGPPPAVAQFESAIDEQAGGVFDLRTVADRDAAVAAIEARELYGAVLLGERPEVLTASAASPVVAQQLTALASQLEARANAAAAAAAPEGVTPPAIRVEVDDVVPLDEDDPRGAGLVAAMFPLVIAGVIGGVVVSLAVAGRLRRLLALGVFAAIAAPVLAGILQGWYGVLPGDPWAVMAVFAAALLAVATPIVGLGGLLGRAGVALGAVTIVLVANPIASAAQPAEFLPAPWGAVGQWFPPGASATLVRDVAYFPGADTAFPWLVLAVWAVAGLALALVRPDRREGRGRG